MLDPAYHMNAGLSGYTQVLAALLGSGFKEDFQRRVRIQAYDSKVPTQAQYSLACVSSVSGVRRRRLNSSRRAFRSRLRTQQEGRTTAQIVDNPVHNFV